MNQIDKKLFEISKEFKKYMLPDESLFSGQSGIAISIAYINKKYLNPDLNSEMEKSLQKSLGVFEKVDSTYTFCSGYAGICWGLNHLVDQNHVDANVNSLFEDIHPHLINTSENDLQFNFLDFMHGGLGAGIYFLDLLPNQMAEDHIRKTILFLHQYANVEDSVVKWANVHIQIDKNGTAEYNLGLAHGMPSIVWFLSKCYEKKIEKEKCLFLINGAVKWLIRQKLIDDSISIYPTTVGEATSVKNSRLGWCYGDLGIASTLWQAGKALNNGEFKKEAIDIMLHASMRRNLQENLINDAGLCHGTAGIAHIFNRFFWETKNPVFKDAADYWIDETLKMAYHKDGLAGYKSWRGTDKSWTNDYGLLEGIAGIGLALYSHISDEEPKWDRCLLLS